MGPDSFQVAFFDKERVWPLQLPSKPIPPWGNVTVAHSIPFLVSFRGREVLVGQEAMALAAAPDPTNTITRIRELLGRRYSDEAIQRLIREVPYRIVDKDDRPYVEVDRNGSQELFSAEELTALCLSNLKESIDRTGWIGTRSVAISVPADFTELQHEAVKNALMIA
jgi:heat shock protein 5